MSHSFYDTPDEAARARHRALHDMSTQALLAMEASGEEDPRWLETARLIVVERAEARAAERMVDSDDGTYEHH